MFIRSGNHAPETRNMRDIQTRCYQGFGVSHTTAISCRIYHPNSGTYIPVANYLKIRGVVSWNVAKPTAKTRNARNSIAPYKRVPTIIYTIWVIVSIVSQIRRSETNRLVWILYYRPIVFYTHNKHRWPKQYR